jgi:hypothetical protein
MSSNRATEAAIRHQRRRAQALMGVWVGGTLVALVATVALLESCGNSRTSASRRVSYDQQDATAPQAVVASTGAIPAETSTGLATVNTIGGESDGLTVPPDVVASVSDSFVKPGQPIEVSVEGTPTSPRWRCRMAAGTRSPWCAIRAVWSGR